MSKIKALAVGLLVTAATIAVIFAVVRRFAPDNVKAFFRV